MANITSSKALVKYFTTSHASMHKSKGRRQLSMYNELELTISSTHSISGQMTGALTVYSATFMRYSLAVSPKNYLLFGCHAINFTSQITQGVRWYGFW